MRRRIATGLLPTLASPALAAGVVPDGAEAAFIPALDLHSTTYIAVFAGLVAASTVTAFMSLRERRRAAARERALCAELEELRGAEDRAALLMGSERQLLVSASRAIRPLTAMARP